jgi:uncharacterized protein YcfJ
MKRLFYVAICLTLILLNTGCQSNKTRVAEGAVIGGLLGGAAGGIIGNQSGNAGMGAGIGIAAGAVTGAIIGSQINKPQTEAKQKAEAKQETKNTAPAKTEEIKTLSMQQIVEFTKQGLTDDEIINKIKATNSKFNLTKDGIDYLKQQRVSQKVIDAMQAK